MEIYIVQPGDTVYSIAAKFSVSPERIISDNGLFSPESISVGQALLILIPEITHIVKSNDTINSIVSLYNITIYELLQNNPYLANYDHLEPGQELVIKYAYEKQHQISFCGFVYHFINRSILRSVLPYVTYLIIFGYGFNDDGSIISVDDADIIALAKENSSAVLLSLSLINNQGQFVSNKITPLLTDINFQNRVISGMINEIISKGAEGMDIDMEYIPPEYREEFAAFAENAAAQLHEYGLILNIDLAPKTSADQPGTLYEAHDYRLLGNAADMVFLMTYEWGYKYGQPMAIAPLPNVQNVLEYALTEISADKIYLGIPNYAYDWPLPFIQGETAAEIIGNLTAAERAYLNNVQISFDDYSQNPFYNYTDNSTEHIVWFEDVRSMKASYELIISSGIIGGGYWNFMRSFPQGYLLLSTMFNIEKF